MYGKAIKETQSNIHTNQRNPMENQCNKQRTRKNIEENHRKATESMKFKGNPRNLKKSKNTNINLKKI